MKKLLRSFAAVAVAIVATGLVVGTAGTAYAAGNPPWEPVANPPQVGSLTFYNAAGQQITGGSTTAQPFAAYVEGSSATGTGAYTKATLYGYTPVLGQLPTAWTGEAFGGSPTYPNASAPGPLNSATLPVYTGAATDESWATYASDIPNSDTSPSDGYAGLYVVRLKTSGNSLPSTTNYDSADIQISGSTWSVVYPTPSLASTTTTLGTSPTGPQVQGTSVTLTATVSPSAPGTVQFEYGSTDIGLPVTVTAGVASIATTSLPVGAPDNLSAVFTPAQFSAYTGSTGTATYTITPPPAAGTTTALAVNPSTAPADSPVSITASVTNTATSAALTSGTGTVNFYDNGASASGTITSGSVLLGTEPVGSGGVATLPYDSFTQGVHNLVAVFAPANTAVYNGSTSPNLPFTVTAPQYVPNDQQTLDVGIPAGTLLITTPYTPTAPFQLGTASLNVVDNTFTASAQFGGANSQYTGNGTTTGDGGVVITSTEAGNAGWTASAEVSNFTDGVTPTPDLINAQNLAFTGLTETYPAGNALNDVTLTPVQSVAVNHGVPWSANGSTGPSEYTGTAGDDGLGGTAHTFASAPGGDSVGTVWIDGLLTLIAPTSTPAGTYTATLTFTIT